MRSEFVVPVSGQKLILPVARWNRMANESDYAENFESTVSRPPRNSQVLTVFKNRMTADRRVGKQISDDEYLEIFCAGPSRIVVQVRRDHGAYWLLSREVFDGTACEIGRYFAGEALDRISSSLRGSIDRTRSLLGEMRLVP